MGQYKCYDWNLILSLPNQRVIDEQLLYLTTAVPFRSIAQMSSLRYTLPFHCLAHPSHLYNLWSLNP
jgi:hypothetical protein